MISHCNHLSALQPDTAVAGVPAGETGEAPDGVTGEAPDGEPGEAPGGENGEVGEVGELPVGEASGLLGVCVGKLKVLTLNGSSALLTR